jgi:hypothetical protein
MRNFIVPLDGSAVVPFPSPSADKKGVSAWLPACNYQRWNTVNLRLNAFDVAWDDFNTICEAKIVKNILGTLQFSGVGRAAALAGAMLMILLPAGPSSIAPSLLAKDPPAMQRGLLLSMDSETCGTAEGGGKTVAGEILGTDSEKKMTQEILCQDNVLQADRIVYHIRLKDMKHPILLSIGDSVEFRIEKSSLFLLDPESHDKEHEYVVISMAPRTDSKDAANPAPAPQTQAANTQQ